MIMIIGAGLVGRVMGSGATRRRPLRVLAFGSIASALGVLGIAAVGLSKMAPGVLPAAIAIGLWFVWSLMFGLLGPVRAACINEFIPSAQRATVLSLDSLFGDAGGALGQPALGWVATVASLPLAWAISAVAFLGAAPLYFASDRAARRLETTPAEK
jgi:sugar phosphate permease